ncbi:hypothetical protein [Salinarimonas sp.]|uniref:hypothetical protein n=1 Tax=Salinarimonas sp. TaxID=2766526 RepID=UPI0032D965B8
MARGDLRNGYVYRVAAFDGSIKTIPAMLLSTKRDEATGADGFWDPLRALVCSLESEGFVILDGRDTFAFRDNLVDAFDYLDPAP